MKTIALLGEFDPARETQIATMRAIEHSADLLGLAVESKWVSTTDITDDLFRHHDAIWIAPGSNYQDQEKLFRAIRFARERAIPCLGTCGGFQHMILEYARHELGFTDAQSEEYDPQGSTLFISQLACSLRGREMKLEFMPGTLVERLYGGLSAVERYYCGLGINPAFTDNLRSGKMKITGKDPEGDIRVIEWPDHPFFLGTLFVPQAGSSPGRPHPVVSGFLRAIAGP
jgi:CTP synthase (UTP-ammonia lyase)